MNKRWYGITALIILFCMLFSLQIKIYASDNSPNGIIYELQNDSGYDVSEDKPIKKFKYGRNSMGELILFGTINKESTYNGVTAYSVSDVLTFGYKYDGEYQTKNKDAWNIYSDGGKKVNGTKTGKVKTGSILIEKSVDRKSWKKATDPCKDFFAKNKDGKENLYSIELEDIKDGMYYRVTVAYTMARRTGVEKIAGLIPDDVYEYLECIEIYECYIESDNDDIVIMDLVNRTELENNSETKNGFCIQKKGSTDTVTVSKDGSEAIIAENCAYFIEPGVYVVESITNLGKKYSDTIIINPGLMFTELFPKVFTSDKNKGFPMEKKVVGNTVFGNKSLTTLSFGTISGCSVTQSKKNGTNAYGVIGENVSIFLKVHSDKDNLGNGWIINDNSWGKKKKDNIEGVTTGEIGKGALIIQTSKDGKNWTNMDKEVYADGLYTTDFATYYDTNENVLIYTPKGKDILEGLYVRILFAYQVYNKEEKEYTDYLEEYKFYLCSNELEAVTFHNLSVEEILEEELGDEDEITIELHKSSETLISGSGTTTGFSVDTSLNPTVTYSVKRDGKEIQCSLNDKYTASGKYEIEITSAVGDKKNIVIYVDKSTDEEALELYFGEGFLTGKRIYSQGEYPKYEGGEVQYNIANISDSYLPISGTITNLDTGNVIEVSRERNSKNGIISEPGNYVARFTTDPNSEKDVLSGDLRVFTFYFSIIPNGTAPGPVINQENLKKYSMTNVSDSYPMYYGLTYQSATKGYITLAFATKEAAVKYAYEYERNMVEQQDDGSFRYMGAFYVAQKEKYNSAWDLTDAMNCFAEQAVQELYFDLSDEFTYLTLEDKIIDNTENLRTLSLDRSVTIFMAGEKEELCSMNALPVISQKLFSYLNPGGNGKVTTGYNDFEFIKDKYECDSSSVVIVDANGKEYPIEYNSGVGTQLEKANCPSGIITINEKTVYGDQTSYEAIFIEDDINTSVLTLKLFIDGEEKKVAFTQNDEGKKITVDAFSISSVEDELEQYPLVTISNSTHRYYYVADKVAKDAWSEPGEYNVTVTNRLGYNYTIFVTINESDYATLEFNTDGKEEVQTIVTAFGAKDIALPELSRKGYELAGFSDEDGVLYTSKIEEILFKGTKVLSPVWKAKEYTVHHVNVDDEEILPDTVVAYDGIYQLPIPKSKEGTEFAGWQMNAELINTSELLIDTEGDITLVAVFKNVETKNVGNVKTEVTKTIDDVDNKRNNSCIIIFIVVAIIIALIIIFIVIRRKKEAVDINDTSMQDDNLAESQIEAIQVSKRGDNDDETMDEE